MNLKTQNAEFKNPNWGEIKIELNKLGGNNNGYFILENDSGDYVQCAGNSERLTVEYRLYSEFKFKHYVIGKDKNPIIVNWVALQNNVGPIMVHEEEVLNLKDAKSIFKEFFKRQTIPTKLNKRNVTKLYMKK